MKSEPLRPLGNRFNFGNSEVGQDDPHLSPFGQPDEPRAASTVKALPGQTLRCWAVFGGSRFKRGPCIARTQGASTRYIWPMDHADSPQVFLSRSQFEARLGLRPGGLAGATLPPPDAIIGPVNKDGSLPRGTIRGWLPDTVDYWKRTRLGQGFRSDVRDRPVAVRPPRPRSSTTGRFLSRDAQSSP